jgi:hypothetical protein
MGLGMKPDMKQPIRRASAARILGASVMLLAFGGCSADDIQLDGKLFDAVGIGSNSKVKRGEPVMASRAPLVLPPNLERLPQPGEQPGAESTDVAAIADPDKKLIVSEVEMQKRQAEYCKVHYEMAIAHGDRDGADLAEGPMGSCRGSVLNAVNLNIGGNK